MLKKKTTVYTAFSEYTIDKQINQGGNGTVFLVHDQNNEEFALKAIDRNKTSNEKLKRFKNEIVFCENNVNPNIIRVLDHGAYTENDVNVVFYIMPVYGQTLRDLMHKGIAAERVLPIITGILSGLRFAHEKGVWHRDIKPENILIDKDGKSVIADFGIAHFSSDELATLVETKQSDRMANFQYAAPEQRAKGVSVDGRADIYAVGLILNEMFTKKLPLGSNYKKIAEVNQEYSWLDPIVDLMLQQLPSNRLYPASTVATRMLAAQKDWHQSQELLKLAQEEPNNDGPYQMQVPTVRDSEYTNEELKVYLDGIEDQWFATWFSILQGGQYGHTAIMGFETYRLRGYLPDCIAMPISASYGRDIKTIALSMKDWIKQATGVFNNQVRADYNREMTERIRRKEAEIQRLKNEAKMRSDLKGIFD